MEDVSHENKEGSVAVVSWEKGRTKGKNGGEWDMVWVGPGMKLVLMAECSCPSYFGKWPGKEYVLPIVGRKLSLPCVLVVTYRLCVPNPPFLALALCYWS